MTEHNNITVSRELLRQILELLKNGDTYFISPAGDLTKPTIAGLRTALEQPAVEPYGHVTVRRLSQRFENHVDQYQFYPAGHVPYTDNVDECIAVYTAPQAQQPAPVQELTNPPSLRDRKPAFVMMKLRSGQQPRKAVKLTNEELVGHYCAIANGKEWAIGGLSDAVPFARAIEQAVLEKNGVTE